MSLEFVNVDQRLWFQFLAPIFDKTSGWQTCQCIYQEALPVSVRQALLARIPESRINVYSALDHTSGEEEDTYDGDWSKVAEKPYSLALSFSSKKHFGKPSCLEMILSRYLRGSLRALSRRRRWFRRGRSRTGD